MADNAKSLEDCTSIEEVRHGIDTLDREIVRLIGTRSRYVKAAAKFKASEASVRAPERQKAMLEERRRWAGEEGLNPDAIEKMYRDLISYFIGRELKDWKSTD